MNTAAVTDLALRLVRIPSLSGREGAVAAEVAGAMRALGLDPQVDALGNVVGGIDAGPGPTVVLDSHMDTVGVTDPAAWSHDPAGTIADGRLYGRGAMDMKGPLAAAIHGVAALRGRLRGGRVLVAATVGEELVEGPALAAVARRLHADRILICEATSLRLAVGQRGRAEILVETFGRPTHSSRPELGVNAAELMADAIIALRRIEAPHHAELGAGVLVLTDVLSRPYPGLSVVPDQCAATFDRRTLPGETAEGVLAPVAAALQGLVAGRAGARAQARIAEDDVATYTGYRLRAPNFAPAWYRDPADPFAAAALAAIDRAGPEAGTTHYAFCTNGSGTAAMGLPTLGFGPGEEALAHRVDEFIAVADLEAAVAAYAAIAEALAGLGG